MCSLSTVFNHDYTTSYDNCPRSNTNSQGDQGNTPDEASNTPLQLPSKASSVITKMDSIAIKKFLINIIKHYPFSNETKERLDAILALPPIFYERLTAYGFTCPPTIMNSFKGGVRTVAKSFGQFQPSLLYGENAKYSMQLVRLAKLLLNVDMNITEFSREKWKKHMKRFNFIAEFNSYSDEQIGDLEIELNSSEHMEEANQFMRKVRAQLTIWLKRESPPSTIGHINSISSEVSSLDNDEQTPVIHRPRAVSKNPKTPQSGIASEILRQTARQEREVEESRQSI